MLEVVISFPPTEHLNNRVLNSDGNVSIQCKSGKTNNSENKLIQKRNQKKIANFLSAKLLCASFVEHALYSPPGHWVLCKLSHLLLLKENSILHNCVVMNRSGGFVCFVVYVFVVVFPDGNVDLKM